MYILISLIILALFFAWIVLYNSIIKSKNDVEESFSTIDTVLQNRYNVVPNLVAVVKKYADHEKEIFSEVSRLRSELLKSEENDASQERFEKEKELGNGLKSLFAISENYPELQASTNFLNLQEEISGLDDRLHAARRAYNAAVKELRNKKETIPSNLVAKTMKLKTYELFEAQDEAKIEKMDVGAMF